MDSTILATRRAVAINSIVEAATVLSNRHNLPADLTARLTPGGKDPQVKDLYRLEALADILNQLAGPKESPSAPLIVPTATPGDLPAPVLDGEPEPAAEEQKKRSARKKA